MFLAVLSVLLSKTMLCDQQPKFIKFSLYSESYMIGSLQHPGQVGMSGKTQFLLIQGT